MYQDLKYRLDNRERTIVVQLYVLIENNSFYSIQKKGNNS